MRRHVVLTALFWAMSTLLFAQRSLMIERIDNVTDYIPTDEIEQITFSEDLSQFIVASKDNQIVVDRADVKTMGYTETPSAFQVEYEGATAKIRNPYLLQGVTADVQGAHVAINNSNVNNEFSFELCGSTPNGSLLYNGEYKATFILNGVSITNPSGAAIDIECGKRIAMELKKGTENTLVDGANGDWKAALYCKGHLEIDKAGTLNVTGNTKHAISAKEYIQLKKADGGINILAAKGDGIHCQQYFLANGYTVNINKVEGDGIQAELSGDEPYEEEYADGSICIQGGAINFTSSAADISGLKADADIVINEEKSVPNITLSTTGNGSKGIKAGGKLAILGGNINIKTTGGRYTETSTTRAGWRPGGGGGGFPGGGSTENGSSAKGIKTKGAIDIAGGNITVSTAGNGAEGIESKTGVTISGGQHYLKCYDDAINCSGQILFNGGITVCCSTGNDAVDSNYGRAGAIVIGDGIVFTYTTKGSPEMGFDCDNNSYIQIKGKGIGISAGGNQGGSNSATISNASQGYAFVTSSVSYQAGRYYTLADASGKNLVTYSFEGNVSSSCQLITAAGMVKGSNYTIKYSTSAPTDASTAFHGLYLGSTAKGTTNLTSFTAK